MATNGMLPDSALAAIPGGRLRRDAAGAWNAMNAESEHRYGVTLRPLGPLSSDRTVTQQRQLRREWTAKGKPQNAAVPGTSNHGWGLAVDVASQRIRWVIDQIGQRYGYAKAWSSSAGTGSRSTASSGREPGTSSTSNILDPRSIAMSPNRVVGVLTPLVFAPAAGWVALWLHGWQQFMQTADGRVGAPEEDEIDLPGPDVTDSSVQPFGSYDSAKAFDEQPHYENGHSPLTGAAAPEGR